MKKTLGKIVLDQALAEGGVDFNDQNLDNLVLVDQTVAIDIMTDIMYDILNKLNDYLDNTTHPYSYEIKAILK